MELEVQPGAVRARSLVIPCPATGRPGTSCSTRVRRPWLTATTPQSGHPISAHGVATVTVNRAGVRATPCTCTPSSPSRTSHRAHGSVAGALAHPVALVTVEVLEWNGSLVASDLRGPRPPHPLLPARRTHPHQKSEEPHIGGTEATYAGRIRGNDRRAAPRESSPTRSGPVGSQPHTCPRRRHGRRVVGSLQRRVWIPRPAGDRFPNACVSNDSGHGLRHPTHPGPCPGGHPAQAR